MIKLLMIIPILFIAIVLGISLYLQPDDLRQCNGVVAEAGDCGRADAIIVISGGDTDARTDEGIRLFQNGWSRYLILSGAAEDKAGPSNASAMRQRAIAAGVPAFSIRVDEYSKSTKQNAENIANILRSIRANSVILVTSGYHQKRASLEFSRSLEGVRVINSPLDQDRDWSVFWWLTPRGWSLAFSEISKIILFNLGLSQ